MKAYLEIELIGDNTRQLLKSYGNLVDSLSPGLGTETFGDDAPMGWVAEITGKDPIYKYSRHFLKGKKDYSRANSKGSRGVYMEYVLEQGKYYEVKAQITWKREEHYFCTVDGEGNIVKVEESEMASKLTNVALTRYDKKLSMVISNPVTEQQKRAILDKMRPEHDRINHCMMTLLNSIPHTDLLNSLEQQCYIVSNERDLVKIGYWKELERAISNFNYCANILNMQKVTFEKLLEGVREWLRKHLESTYSQQRDGE